jgi:ssDNA-binding Zn-finger/Zn-ribbon topoisomerase 1
MDLGKQEEESDDEYLPPAKSTLAQERKAYELEDIVKCPKCDSAMRLRTNRNTGTSFFGCVDFPDCKGTREADGSVGITTRKSSPPPPPPPASYRPPYSSVGYDYNDEDDIPF